MLSGSSILTESDYLCGNDLSEGGFSRVLLGQLRANQKFIAIKCVEISVFELTTNESILALKNEQDILEKIANQCPEIVKFYGVRFYEKNTIFYGHLIIEYANRGDLNEWLLNNKKRRDWSCLYSLIINITQGLYYLHEISHIIHGDIKSANILVFEENDILYAKITDFGLSMQESGLPKVKLVPKVRAPEIMTENDRFTYSSDVYSLGIVFLEMAIGDPLKNFNLKVQNNCLQWSKKYLKGDLNEAELLFKKLIPFILKEKIKTFPPKIADLIKSSIITNPIDRIKTSDILTELKKTGPFNRISNKLRFLRKSKARSYPNFFWSLPQTSHSPILESTNEKNLPKKSDDIEYDVLERDHTLPLHSFQM